MSQKLLPRTSFVDGSSPGGSRDWDEEGAGSDSDGTSFVTAGSHLEPEAGLGSQPAASLSYIIHQPSGDSVPTTRELGGDRSFVPAVSPEVWVNQGDPTIHTTRP